MAKKIRPNLYQYPGGTRAADMPVTFNSETPRAVVSQAERAAFYLFQHIVYCQQHRRSRPQARAFAPAPLYGVFRGDVLVNWGVGRRARYWAERTALNCWDGELRAQYLGTF